MWVDLVRWPLFLNRSFFDPRQKPLELFKGLRTQPWCTAKFSDRYLVAFNNMEDICAEWVVSAAPRGVCRMSGLLPSMVLFFLAPLVSEFLLGNLPITMLPVLLILAPMYGGGALLIRELVRRTGRSWPSIMLLGIAYAILEEAFTTQTLFNPNYLHLNLHLLDYAPIKALGIGGWWTMYVISLHAIWSIAVSVALAEGLFPEKATKPWLGTIGLSATALIFMFGIAATTFVSLKMEREKGGIYVASISQFIGAAVVCILLVVAAFALPMRQRALRSGTVANPWLVGTASLVAGSIFLLVPPFWGWGAVAIYVALYLLVIAFLLYQSSLRGWGARHRLALASGAALAYALHSFPQPSVTNEDPTIDLIGNSIFAVGAIVIIAIGFWRNRDHRISSDVSL